MKICSKCKLEKPLSEFTIRRDRPCGYMSMCKTCNSNRVATSRQTTDYYKSYYINNREVVLDKSAKIYKANPSIVKDRYLKAHYGITLVEYNAMLDNQHNVCAICGRPEKTGRMLSVDHDHATGAIRGLLCNACNTSLGNVNDNITILQNMIMYLEKYKCG